MDIRNFGTTDLKVSALGFGAGMIGDENLSEEQVSQLLNSVIDMGVTLIDTARGYGSSEERIGRHLAHRRSEVVLSTKVGYGIEGYQDWTYDCITVGVDEALKRLRTDYLDLVHLHSCPIEVLKQGEVIEALEHVLKQGKIRVAAYSGENEALDYAIHSQGFNGVMSSLNICDQQVIDRTLYHAKNEGMGFIAKRPIANAPWRFEKQPVGHYCEEYWKRWQAMAFDWGLSNLEIALRFSAYTFGVDSCIVGTTNLEHLKQNVSHVEKGKLPDELIAQIRTVFRKNNTHWIGQV